MNYAWLKFFLMSPFGDNFLQVYSAPRTTYLTYHKLDLRTSAQSVFGMRLMIYYIPPVVPGALMSLPARFCLLKQEGRMKKRNAY